MKCPKCQAENGDSAKFCADCGQPFQVNQVCSSCNHVNKLTARFCEECGKPLGETQDAVHASAAAPCPSVV